MDKMTKAYAQTKDGLKILADLCRAGLTDTAIATKIGIDNVTLSRWRAAVPSIRATMDEARGKPVKPMAHDITHVRLREPKTDKERYARISQKAHINDVSAVKCTVAQWMDKRELKHMPLTRESLCEALNISIAEYRRIVDDRAIFDEAPMIVNVTTGKVRAEVAEILRGADAAILSDIVDSAMGRNPTGAIFLLKNHWGYVDKQTTEISDKSINVSWQTVDNNLYKAVDKDRETRARDINNTQDNTSDMGDDVLQDVDNPVDNPVDNSNNGNISATFEVKDSPKDNDSD